MSIEDNFRQFASNLELTEAEIRKVSSVQADLRSVIESHPHVLKTELIGSYDRKTKIRPLHDIDILVILTFDKDIEFKHRAANPRLALSDIVKTLSAVRKKMPVMGPRAQKRSINIRTAGVGFDLVPAFELKRGYAIPDKALGSWILTDPLAYAKMVTERNQSADCNNKFVPFVKMIKSWAATNEVTFLSSYLTELLAHNLITGIQSYARCCLEFFSKAQTVVLWPIVDPVTGQDTNDLSHSQKLDLIKKLCFFAEAAAQAIILEDQGKITPAAIFWRRVFGRDFPLRMGPGG